MTLDAARILASIPLILAGQAISTLGYRVAGARHLNPHTRSSYPQSWG
jgi:hypothetical protein